MYCLCVVEILCNSTLLPSLLNSAFGDIILMIDISHGRQILQIYCFVDCLIIRNVNSTD